MSSLPLAEYRCIVCVQKQAEAAADQLAVMATDLGHERVAVFTSDFLRARQTAETMVHHTRPAAHGPLHLPTVSDSTVAAPRCASVYR